MTLIGLFAAPMFAMGPESGGHHGAPFACDKGLLDSAGFDRSVLADKGVNVYLSNMTVYQNITKGGVDGEPSDKTSNSNDCQLYFDSEKPGFWKCWPGRQKKPSMRLPVMRPTSWKMWATGWRTRLKSK